MPVYRPLLLHLNGIAIVVPWWRERYRRISWVSRPIISIYDLQVVATAAANWLPQWNRRRPFAQTDDSAPSVDQLAITHISRELGGPLRSYAFTQIIHDESLCTVRRFIGIAVRPGWHLLNQRSNFFGYGMCVNYHPERAVLQNREPRIIADFSTRERPQPHVAWSRPRSLCRSRIRRSRSV